MLLLEIQKKYRVDTEDEAKELIEEYKDNQRTEGYRVKKASYEYKCKKAKGEIIAEGYLTTLVLVYDELWGDI